jgi:hypothetical protein
MMMPTQPMNPSIPSISTTVCRDRSRISSTSLSERASILVMLKPQGLVFLPVCTEVLVPNEKGPIE